MMSRMSLTGLLAAISSLTFRVLLIWGVVGWSARQADAASRPEIFAKSVPAFAGEPTEPAGSTAAEKTLIVKVLQLDL